MIDVSMPSIREPATSARVLILTDQPLRAFGDMGGGINRRKALQLLAESGVKVTADGGGRLLVVEASDAAASRINEQIPGATILDLEEGFDERLGELDEQDALFAKALAIQVSPEYREQKARQEPGETPEEQLLFSAPCVPPED